MIDVVSVKNRILEKAIRGELVPHIGSAEQVEVMLEGISAEYLDLAARKETKICKTAEMFSDDIYDIPNNWKWVPLGKLCIMLSRGKSPKYSEEKKYPVFAQKCNQPDGLALWKALFLDPETLEKWPEYFRLRDKDVVINSTGTGTVGRIGYYTSETLNVEYPFMVPDSHVTVVRTGEGVVSRYIYYALRSISLQNIMEKTFRGSTNQKEFYIDSVYATPIPIPPTEEQILIVNKLDEVFGQLKLINELQLQYSSDLEVLKSKIIDAGIQGKITEQLLEDGTAEELLWQIAEEKNQLIKEKKIKATKSLAEITEDEIPFEIPNNWKWIRLGDLIQIKSGDGLIKTDMVDGDIPVYGGNGISGYHNKCNVNKRTVVIGRVGVNCGSVHITEKRAWVTDNAFITSYPEKYIDQNYLSICLKYLELGKRQTATAQPVISGAKVYPVLFPVPPLAEQRRIAIRIMELLSVICEESI